MPSDFTDEFLDDLYRRYYQKLRVYCYALVCGESRFSQDVEECIQDVFFLAYQKRVQLFQCDYLEAWLKEACKRRMKKAISRAKGKRRKAETTSLEAFPTDSRVFAYHPIERWLDEEEKQSDLQRLEQTLTEEEKELVLSHWRDGATLQELAKRLGTTAGTVKSKLNRLRKKAKRIVSENVFFKER